MLVDAFMFHNEFDLLEIRLTELDGLVDRFVLVESPRTFTGRAKPLHFDANAGRYARWHHRIRHVVVDDMPDGAGITAWDRERHQRDAIARGLTDLHADDIVLVSDCDELPNPEAVVRAYHYQQHHADRPLSFMQALSFFHLNQRCYTAPWFGTQATTAGIVRRVGAEFVRTQRNRPRDTLGYAGWHATNLGDPAWLRNKIKSFSHTECDTPAITDPAHLQRCIDGGYDPSGRTDIRFRPEPIDGSYPATVLADLPRWRHLFTPGAVDAYLAAKGGTDA